MLGCGEDITVRELAEIVMEVVGFKANLVFDATKPDGTPRKLLAITRLKKLGWQPRISLRAGISQTYEWFLANCKVPRTALDRRGPESQRYGCGTLST